MLSSVFLSPAAGGVGDAAGVGGDGDAVVGLGVSAGAALAGVALAGVALAGSLAGIAFAGSLAVSGAAAGVGALVVVVAADAAADDEVVVGTSLDAGLVFDGAAVGGWSDAAA